VQFRGIDQLCPRLSMEPPGAENHSYVAKQQGLIRIQTSPTSSKLYRYGFTRNTGAKTSQKYEQGLSSSRPARTQSPSEETGDEGDSEGHKGKGSYVDSASPSVESSQRESDTKETVRLFRSPLNKYGFVPSPNAIARTLTFRGGCNIGRTWRGCARSAGML
jgi:hypothetical protein